MEAGRGFGVDGDHPEGALDAQGGAQEGVLGQVVRAVDDESAADLVEAGVRGCGAWSVGQDGDLGSCGKKRMWDWLRRALGLPEWAFDVPSGGARVQDGDSLVVGECRIRLSGIDAPEIGQLVCGPGGEDAGRLAASALREMVQRRALWVRPEGQDIYGRIVASVFAEGVGDLSIAMLVGGWWGSAAECGAVSASSAGVRRSRLASGCGIGGRL